jgi:uncharacterized Zn finger protein (UPF0148 family)
MSDFDREAERERLREKYEQDQKEREATERMSELLLQGATMTNAHCSECGDPIFRYDGQEFCANCERPVNRGDGSDATEADERSDDESGDATDVEVTAPSDDTRVVFGGDEETTEQGADRQQPRREPRDRPQERTERRNRRRQSDPEMPDGSRTDTDRQRDQPAADTGREGEHRVGNEGDVEAARASLARTLAAFSQRAEATNDPQRAREHLQAAREAAEALATLRQ